MSGITDVLQSIAPGIATALGGPLAGMAAGWLASKMGVPADQVQNTIAGMTPTDLVKMKELEIDFQKFMADNGIKLQLAQIEVNKTEAASANWFVAGWRPFIGWTCGVAFAYSYILLPFLLFFAYWLGSDATIKQLSQLPKLDLAAMLPILGGMLGLGAMRTIEKRDGVQGEH